MSEFRIDYFELMFLAESVSPKGPIARSMCFDSFSDKHYHHMNEEQRLQFFIYVQKQPYFTLGDEQCRHFYARFNPHNQYKVSCFYIGKAQTVDCYRFNDKYMVSRNCSINDDYIKKIVRVHDGVIIKQ